MNTQLINHTSVKIGFVPSHLGLAKTHVPDENGKLARDESGRILLLEGILNTCSASPVKVDVIQIMLFPGICDADMNQLIEGVLSLDAEPQLILMVGGLDPMCASDEDAATQLLLRGCNLAKRFSIKHICSTSVEAWMATPAPVNQAERDQRVAQITKLHHRVFVEGELEQSSIDSWHLEFLRPGEMNTFTSISSIEPVVSELNKLVGSPFFKILVDAAHCGNGDLTVSENQALIEQLAGANQFEVFHASVPTTRGCLSSDDCWVGSLLNAAASSGALKYVFVEVFHHSDPALQPLRDYDEGHGINTTCGRSYADVVNHNIEGIALRMNNLQNREPSNSTKTGEI